jgi:hypothetical protein
LDVRINEVLLYFQLTSLDLEDATEDSIPLNILRDTIRSAAEEIEEASTMLQSIYGMLK